MIGPLIHLIARLACCAFKVTTREVLRTEDHSTEQYRIEQNGTEHEQDYKWQPLEKEVRDELIQQHALRTCQGRACAKCCNQGCQDRFWNCLSITNFCMVTTFVIMVSLGALIVLSVMYIGPYFIHSTYKVAQCEVVSVEPERVVDCNARTTCVKVNVKYTREDGKEVQGLLHIDGDYDECSTNMCVKNGQNLVQAYKPPNSLKCLYDASLKFTTHVLIYGFLPTTAEVVHMLFWPILIIVLGIAAAVFIWCTCGCEYCNNNPPNMNIRTIAANLRLHGIHTLKSLPVEERRRLVRECTPDPEEEFQTQQMQRV